MLGSGGGCEGDGGGKDGGGGCEGEGGGEDGGLGGDDGAMGGIDGGGSEGEAQNAAWESINWLCPDSKKLRPDVISPVTSGPLPCASYRLLFLFANACRPISVRTNNVKFARLRKRKAAVRALCCGVSSRGSLGLPSSKLTRVRGQSNAQSTGFPVSSR